MALLCVTGAGRCMQLLSGLGHTALKLTMRKYVVINPSSHQRAGQGAQVTTALQRGPFTGDSACD